MKLTRTLKTIALGALVSTGAAFAAEATIGGAIPLNSSVIIYPERQLDFSATATLIKMAEILVTNNAPEFRIKVSFDAAGVAFSGTPILTDLALSSSGAAGWGAGLFNGNAQILDPATGLAGGGACGAAVNIDIDPAGATDASGKLTGCVKALGNAIGNYADLATSPITIGGAAAAFASQTSPTVNASIELQGSWDAGEDVTNAALLAGTYSSTMVVTLESNY